MVTRESLARVLDEMPEDRLQRVLEFAQFLTWQEDREEWHRAGREQLARAYGPSEPEYTENDLRSNCAHLRNQLTIPAGPVLVG